MTAFVEMYVSIHAFISRFFSLPSNRSRIMGER